MTTDKLEKLADYFEVPVGVFFDKYSGSPDAISIYGNKYEELNNKYIIILEENRELRIEIENLKNFLVAVSSDAKTVFEKQDMQK
jgi:regulator of replication initiation timing